MIRSQTLALFVDEYRSLRARRLFWIVLGLSLVFVAALACVANNEEGIEVLVWTLPIEFLSTKVFPRREFMQLMFLTLGFQLWLTWVATILALISTASILPDFISGGAIELTLSKPMGRLRLYLTKYATGLLFVALQVVVFAAGSFLVIGLRGGGWDFRLWLAIPLVVIFFSYLFCFCSLVGLLTRSTIASLILTILLWVVIFLVHLSETGIILQFRVQKDLVVATLATDIEARKIEANNLRTPPEDEPPDATTARLARLAKLEDAITFREAELEADRKSARTLNRVHAILFAVKTVLPKTSETMELMGRWMLDPDKLAALQDSSTTTTPPVQSSRGSIRVSQRTVAREMQAEVASRSVWWVVGTSLAFEVVLVGAGAIVFCRRDF